jgi:translation initiation factor 1
MKQEDWKQKLSFAYSTNPDYKGDVEAEQDLQKTPPSRQNLVVGIERKHRGGKTVTIVRGFAGPGDELEELGRRLKNRCGVGGTVKDGEILIQGEIKQKVADLLREWGYRVKISG